MENIKTYIVQFNSKENMQEYVKAIVSQPGFHRATRKGLELIVEVNMGGN